VPLIKLQIDLQEIRLLNRQREEKDKQEEQALKGEPTEENKVEPLPAITEIEYSMKILDIDITFDDYSSSIQLQQQQQHNSQLVENPQSGVPANNQRQAQFAPSAHVFQP